MKFCIVLLFCVCMYHNVYSEATTKDETVACVKCGSIQGCDCRANEMYPKRCGHSGGPTWRWDYHHVSFVHSSNIVQKVLVSSFAVRFNGYYVMAGSETFPSIIIMPPCTVKRDGYEFSKWQQVDAISNAFYSVGDTVKISSNTTFTATWRPSRSFDAK